MKPTTELCHATAADIVVRGKSLPRELIGQVTFTELVYRHLTGRDPSAGQTALLDACLVTLMEHGLTPSAIATRLTYGSAPEAMQGAVAAGLLGVGSVFVGASEACAALLVRIAAADDPADRDAAARAVVAESRATGARLPGFGHPVHRPVDPRTTALLAVARAHGLHGRHADALARLSAAVDAAAGTPVPVNATGAVAAVLLDAGLPVAILRGIAIISRCAGLVGHIREEQEAPAMRALWEAGLAAVPYQAPTTEPEEDAP